MSKFKKHVPFFLFYTFFFNIFFSCDDTLEVSRGTIQEEKAAFDISDFNKKIISSMDKYSRLKDFLLSNLDTIIGYRNSTNKVTWVGAGSRPDSSGYESHDCWQFLKMRRDSDITDVPKFLYSKLDSLFVGLRADTLDGFTFTVCRDSTIEFDIGEPADDSKNDILIVHQLTWNKLTEKKDNYDFSKDTLLGEKWRYNISVAKKQPGW